MQTQIRYKKSLRCLLVQEFYEAPVDTWFRQETVAALRNCSESTVERDRWSGQGVPFIKSGKNVRYTKQAILAWLGKHTPVQSTAQYDKVEGV